MSLLQMSFSAAIMILAIVIVRALTINKLPKKVFVILWEAVLLRLLLPISIPSIFSIYSLLKKAEPVQNVLTEIPEGTIIYKIAEEPLNLGTVPLEVIQQPEQSISVWTVVWIAGMMLCVLFFAISYLRCLFEFRISIPLHNEFADKWLEEYQLRRHIHLRQSDRISAPLTYGIFRPVILMPKKTDWDNEQQLQYILCHEYIHISRFDVVTKLIATVVLCIHWFNPLVWVMYILFNRDIELSCDESVVRKFGEASRADYAKTLITMEEKKSGLTPLYNSFSRNAIEERIVAIMKTKKATVGVIVASILIIAAVVVLFVTSAEESEANEGGDNTGTVQELEETQSVEWIGVYKDTFTSKDEEDSNYYIKFSPKVEITDAGDNYSVFISLTTSKVVAYANVMDGQVGGTHYGPVEIAKEDAGRHFILEFKSDENPKQTIMYCELEYIDEKQIQFRYADTKNMLKGQEYYPLVRLKYSSYDSTVSHIMEPTTNYVREYMHTLRAEEVRNLEIDFEQKIPVNKLVNASPGYEENQKMMMFLISGDEVLETDGGFYLADRSIRIFSVSDNEVINEEWLLVFSKDFSTVYHFQLSGNENSVVVGLVRGINSELLEYMKEKPDEKFIILLNGSEKLALNAENEIALTEEEIDIVGDYYHALDYEALAISYNDIVDNLIWVDLETAEIEVVVSDFVQAYFAGDADILEQYWAPEAYGEIPEPYPGKAEEV